MTEPELLAALQPSTQSAVEQVLPGGCRPWTLDVPVAELVGAGRALSGEGLARWPAGAPAASVCGPAGKRYAVTFRPLVPGERPAAP